VYSAACAPGRSVVYIGWVRETNQPAPLRAAVVRQTQIEPDSPIRHRLASCGLAGGTMIVVEFSITPDTAVMPPP